MSLLRSAKFWSYLSVALFLILFSLIGYEQYHANRIKGLIENLKSSDPQVAQSAATSLAEMGDDVVGYLKPLLKGMNSQTRAYAADALSRTSSAVPSLVLSLKDQDVEERAAAVEVLGKIGAAASGAVPALIEALQDENEDVRKRVMLALGEIKDTRAIVPLINNLKQKSGGSGVAGDAAEQSLVEIGPNAIPDLIIVLKSDTPKMRRTSARIMGKMGTAASGAVPALIEALNDKDQSVCNTVKSALGEIKDTRAIGPLIDTFYRDLSDNNAPAALGKIGSAAIPQLVDKLKSDNPKVLEFSASALGEIGPAASSEVPALLPLLKNPAWSVRKQVIRALGKIKDQQAVNPLLAMLKENPPPEGVIEALGELGPLAQEAVPLLFNMAWVDNLHEDAIAALKKISPESMNIIIYNEQKYEYLDKAVSVELLDATMEEDTTLSEEIPTKVFFTFKWKLANRMAGVNFCSTILIDKGANPFDGKIGRPPIVAGQDTYSEDAQLKVGLNYREYAASPFEWGVRVIACRDEGARCDKSGSCVGRVFDSPTGNYPVE